MKRVTSILFSNFRRINPRETKIGATIITLLVLVDQISKALFVEFGSYSINQGMAWNIIKLDNSVMLVLSSFFLLVFILYLLETFPRNNKYRMPYYFVIAGASSNIFDRICYGGVVDFINVPAIPVLNIADLLISCGIITLILINIYAKEGKGRERI